MLANGWAKPSSGINVLIYLLAISQSVVLFLFLVSFTKTKSEDLAVFTRAPFCGLPIQPLLGLGIVSKSVAKQYAEFCVRCDREGLPLLELDDYIKQYCC